MTTSELTFRVCTTCKSPIAYRAGYFECSVSTCNRKRLPHYFCSVQCWDAHSVSARHRDAWALEQTAPSREEWQAERAREGAPAAPPERRRIAVPAPTEAKRPDSVPREILIVVSKLKQYIKAKSGMNTSDDVANALSDHVRALASEAIRSAATDGRRTVLERDVAKLTR